METLKKVGIAIGIGLGLLGIGGAIMIFFKKQEEAKTE